MLAQLAAQSENHVTRVSLARGFFCTTLSRVEFAKRDFDGSSASGKHIVVSRS